MCIGAASPAVHNNSSHISTFLFSDAFKALPSARAADRTSKSQLNRLLPRHTHTRKKKGWLKTRCAWNCPHHECVVSSSPYVSSSFSISPVVFVVTHIEEQFSFFFPLSLFTSRFLNSVRNRSGYHCFGFCVFLLKTKRKAESRGRVCRLACGSSCFSFFFLRSLAFWKRSYTAFEQQQQQQKCFTFGSEKFLHSLLPPRA